MSHCIINPAGSYDLKGSLAVHAVPKSPGRQQINATAENVALVKYAIVRNHEDRYSIWPADRNPPAGWNQTGFVGDRDSCLEEVTELWRDIRPLSIRS